MDDRKIIYTYNKAWEVEKQIYTLGDFKLPRPIAIDSLLYAILGLILAVFISKIPLIGSISPLLLYGGLVVGFPILMKKARIHSKTPARFVASYFSFLSQPKSLTRFQPTETAGAIRFTNVRHKPIGEDDAKTK